MNQIASEIIVCTKCKLSGSRKNAVPGEGNMDSQIMLIGEAPGETEDIRGRPFVGRAGELLNGLLMGASIQRERTFICNIVRCRPPQNREPFTDEIQACEPYLDRQIRAVRPKLVVTLGKHSTACLMAKTGVTFTTITAVQGRFYEVTLLGKRTRLFPCFHPASALHNPRYYEDLTKDFELLEQETRISKLA